MRAIVDGRWRRTVYISPLLTFRYVGTQGEVEAQVLEAVNLIVDVGIADKGTADGTVVFQVKDGDGVLDREVVVGVWPCRVVQCGTRVEPLEVAAEIAVLGIAVIDAVCRIHVDGGADGLTVGIPSLRPHTLGIQVQGQVILEE